VSEIVFQIIENNTSSAFFARLPDRSTAMEAGTWGEFRAHVGRAVPCHFGEGKAAAILRSKPDAN
jgi:hypothetical protein